MSDLVPVSDEQAKAVASVAEFGREAVKATTGAGGWVAAIVQDVPKDLIGVLGGDWLHHTRQRNLATLEAKTATYLENVAAERRTEPSPSLLLPLLTAAVDEDREELQALWAALLANAMTDKGRRVRLEFFNVVRQMEPLDTIVIRLIAHPNIWQRHPNSATPFETAGSREMIQTFVDKSYGFDPDSTQISFDALDNLKCIIRSPVNGHASLTAFGRGLLAACEPPVEPR